MAQTQPFAAYPYSRETERGPLYSGLPTPYIPLEPSRTRAPSYTGTRPEDSPPETLAFYTLDDDMPILVRGLSKIMLGRTEPGEIAPTIDLTGYNGAQQGVSRKHAIILYADGAYSIQDLDSTNGTWLNGERLIPFRPYPFQSTDQLQLGTFQMVVLFRAGKGERLPDPDQPDRLLLQASPDVPLTPQALTQVVGPFLEALAALQQVRDEVLGEPPRPLVIDQLCAGQPILVRCRGASDALRLLRGPVARWRAENEPLLQAIRQNPEGGCEGLEDSEVQLAMLVLDAITPDLGMTTRLHYATRLLPALRALILSELAAKD